MEKITYNYLKIMLKKKQNMFTNQYLNISAFILVIFTLFGCYTASSDSDKNTTAIQDSVKAQQADTIISQKIERKMANAASILNKKQVPVICYHQIREWTAS